MSARPIRSYAKKVHAVLCETFACAVESLPQDMSPQGMWALKVLEEYNTRPAKRLRGSLAAAMYDEASGKEYSREGLELGAVMEVLQNYLLIIDDVMDRSALRRGLPTVHELYKTTRKVSEHEAGMMAINVGLLAEQIAGIMTAHIRVDVQRLVHMSGVIHHNIAVTGLGQIDDLCRASERPPTEAAVLHTYEQKSSYYTFINPLACGLALTGRDDANHDVERFGKPAGVAFQLHDDWLGIFGASDVTGKANLDDIQEGKYTLLVQQALERLEGAERAAFQKIIGNSSATADDLRFVQDVLESSGAAAYVRTRLETCAVQAKQAAREATAWRSGFGEQLCELVDYAVERTW